MLRLNIEQQYAKLALSITDPAITIERQPAGLELYTEAAVVEIGQSRGELIIDQYPCRASCGYKNMADFTYDFAQEGKQAALEAVAKIAADGDRMARIQSKENVIAALAVESTTPEPVEVGIVPIAPPDINYYAHPVEYQVRAGRLDAQFKPGVLDVQLNPGTVEASIAQYQSIRMWITGTVDFSV